jgi:hypothetical protein
VSGRRSTRAAKRSTRARALRATTGWTSGTFPRSTRRWIGAIASRRRCAGVGEAPEGTWEESNERSARDPQRRAIDHLDRAQEFIERAITGD